MNSERLIDMANQIGEFFQAYPDMDEAKLEIAKHLKKFWTRPMREQIVARAQEQGAGLAPMVSEAIREHRSLLA